MSSRSRKWLIRLCLVAVPLAVIAMLYARAALEKTGFDEFKAEKLKELEAAHSPGESATTGELEVAGEKPAVHAKVPPDEPSTIEPFYYAMVEITNLCIQSQEYKDAVEIMQAGPLNWEWSRHYSATYNIKVENFDKDRWHTIFGDMSREENLVRVFQSSDYSIPRPERYRMDTVPDPMADLTPERMASLNRLLDDVERIMFDPALPLPESDNLIARDFNEWQVARLSYYVMARNAMRGDAEKTRSQLLRLYEITERKAGFGESWESGWSRSQMIGLTMLIDDMGMLDGESLARIQSLIEDMRYTPERRATVQLTRILSAEATIQQELPNAPLGNNVWAYFLDGKPAEIVAATLRPVVSNKIELYAIALIKGDYEETLAARYDLGKYLVMANLDQAAIYMLDNARMDYGNIDPEWREKFPYLRFEETYNDYLNWFVLDVAALRYQRDQDAWPADLSDLDPAYIHREEFEPPGVYYRFITVPAFTARVADENQENTPETWDFPDTRMLVYVWVPSHFQTANGEYLTTFGWDDSLDIDDLARRGPALVFVRYLWNPRPFLEPELRRLFPLESPD